MFCCFRPMTVAFRYACNMQYVVFIYLPELLILQYFKYTVSQKNCTPKAGRHKFCYFPITKKSEIYVL